MAYTPVNFINGVTTVQAAWLNGVDEMVYNVLGGWQGQTLAITQAALGIPSGGITLPLAIAEGGTGATSAGAGLTALGGTTLAAAETAINPQPTQTAAELAAGVAPVNFQWPQGDPRRYGAVLNGATDDTAALTAWASVGGNLTFPGDATALISSTIEFPNNTTVTFAGGGTLLNATASAISLITLINSTNVIIRGVSFNQTISASVQAAGVTLQGCTNCTVEECNFTGLMFNGIWGLGCSSCTIRANYFTNGPTQVTDSADINISSTPTAASVNNVIDGNFCYGGREFGVSCWDPYAAVLSYYNVVTNNKIVGPTGYGILFYMPDAGDTYNQAIGNHVEGVTGSISSNPSSGAGIYLVGNGGGGTLIANNTVRNCCINTGNASLAPAGIGISAGASGAAPVVVSGNVITDMPQYHGILVTGRNGVTVTANSIRMPATQTTVGSAITIVNSNASSVVGNSIVLLGTTQGQVGVAVEAISGNYSMVTISGNSISGGHIAHIRIVADGNQYTNLSIVGNVCTGGDSTCIPLLFDSGSCSSVSVMGNNFFSNSSTAVTQTACTAIRYSGNILAAGSTVLVTAGVCTGSFYDRTNFGTGTGAGVSNGATGFVIEQLGTAVPSAGTWAVGDTVRNSAPTSAGVYEWINITAGSPGTWHTISNS